jgi:hypothetical protein
VEVAAYVPSFQPMPASAMIAPVIPAPMTTPHIRAANRFRRFETLRRQSLSTTRCRSTFDTRARSEVYSVFSLRCGIRIGLTTAVTPCQAITPYVAGPRASETGRVITWIERWNFQDLNECIEVARSIPGIHLPKEWYAHEQLYRELGTGWK